MDSDDIDPRMHMNMGEDAEIQEDEEDGDDLEDIHMFVDEERQEIQKIHKDAVFPEEENERNRNKDVICGDETLTDIVDKIKSIDRPDIRQVVLDGIKKLADTFFTPFKSLASEPVATTLLRYNDAVEKARKILEDSAAEELKIQLGIIKTQYVKTIDELIYYMGCRNQQKVESLSEAKLWQFLYIMKQSWNYSDPDPENVMRFARYIFGVATIDDEGAYLRVQTRTNLTLKLLSWLSRTLAERIACKISMLNKQKRDAAVGKQAEEEENDRLPDDFVSHGTVVARRDAASASTSSSSLSPDVASSSAQRPDRREEGGGGPFIGSGRAHRHGDERNVDDEMEERNNQADETPRQKFARGIGVFGQRERVSNLVELQIHEAIDMENKARFKKCFHKDCQKRQRNSRRKNNLGKDDDKEGGDEVQVEDEHAECYIYDIEKDHCFWEYLEQTNEDVSRDTEELVRCFYDISMKILHYSKMFFAVLDARKTQDGSVKMNIRDPDGNFLSIFLPDTLEDFALNYIYQEEKKGITKSCYKKRIINRLSRQNVRLYDGFIYRNKRFASHRCKNGKLRSFPVNVWEPEMPIYQFISTLTTKDDTDFWDNMADSKIRTLAEWISHNANGSGKIAVQPLEIDTLSFSFKNGVLYAGSFVAETKTRIPSAFTPWDEYQDMGVACLRFINAEFDPQWLSIPVMEIPTPYIDSILEHQGYSNDLMKFFYAMFGRLFTKKKVCDNFQVGMFMIGHSQTGKSLFTEIFETYFNDRFVNTVEGGTIRHIEKLGDDLQTNFSFSKLINKNCKAFIIGEMTNRLAAAVGAGQWLTLFSGEDTSCPVKNEKDANGEVVAQSLGCGNYFPSFRDADPFAIARRNMIFRFDNPVASPNESLRSLIEKNELAPFIIKCRRCYIDLLEDAAKRARNGRPADIWNICPREITESRTRLLNDICPVGAFINNERFIVKSPGNIMSLDDLRLGYAYYRLKVFNDIKAAFKTKFEEFEKEIKRSASIKDVECVRVGRWSVGGIDMTGEHFKDIAIPPDTLAEVLEWKERRLGQERNRFGQPPRNAVVGISA
jgi:hypothetical protein